RNKGEIGGSEYLKTIYGLKRGKCPEINLKLEKNLQRAVLEMIDKRIIKSAHDCAEGGIAIALVESCLGNPYQRIGAKVKLSSQRIRTDALLFGESQSRVILSAEPKNISKIIKIARKNKVPVSVIGEVGGDRLIIDGLLDVAITQIYEVWSKAIENYLKE
ncbi:MAG: AIR synthase-related protein, partial [Candidatus Omnitrophota bacterium]